MKNSFIKNIAFTLIVMLLFSVSSWAQEQVVGENVTVFKEKNRFAGWPANYGIWSWGNEIVTGFTYGYHDDDPRQTSHPIKDPTTTRQVRSIDGGKTWKVEKPTFLDENEELKEPTACSGNIDFTQTDFAFKFRHFSESAGFYYSTDRCKTWNGPFTMPLFGRKGLLTRTDYIINGKHDMLVFITSEKDNGKEGWPFCARTTDGGKTWQHVGWIGEQPPVDGYGYAIMPSTVRLENGAILSAIRRGGFIDGKKSWWLESFLSPDDGKSWYMLNEPFINNSGNPASMIVLKDGRIVITYGSRHAPYGIRARISEDQGQTWGEEIILRNDGDSWDIGYPRTIQRADGKIVTVYYYKDASSKERFISATIWDAGKKEKK
jgi:Neuraminidase (sialidase)